MSCKGSMFIETLKSRLKYKLLEVQLELFLATCPYQPVCCTSLLYHHVRILVTKIHVQILSIQSLLEKRQVSTETLKRAKPATCGLAISLQFSKC